MKIVINIDDNLYTRLFDCGTYDAVDMLNACTAIRKGIPLPKEHGRLFILDEELANKFFASFSFSCQKWISEVGISNATLKVIEADKGEVKLNMQEPWEEFQPPCSDFDCDCYEIGEGGCAICVYDCERIIEGEPCHKYKTRGRDKE